MLCDRGRSRKDKEVSSQLKSKMKLKERHYWLGFNVFPGIGPKRLYHLLKIFGSAKKAWHASEVKLRQTKIPKNLIKNFIQFRDELDFSSLIFRLNKNLIRFIIVEDEEYPKNLKKIESPPPLLYIKGRILPQDSLSIAVIGTRKITSYGREVTEKLTAGLSAYGFTIVSGLARGVDSVAHRVALGNKARTLAVLGSGLDRIYPPEHKSLAEEIINQNLGEQGGYREIIARIIGKGAYSQLKFESGAHRVQRVPETESQGRVHTSAATVAILPEIADVEQIEINPADLRVDTFRASGAGGQHVNKTDSAVRLTHIPTGTVVECQDERSQHKNKARAMSLLQSRIMNVKIEKQQAEQAQTRKSLVGSGDRSERIRTYNYPQGRVTDHRINLTLYKLDEIIQGALNQVIEPLINEYQAEQLASLSNEQA